MELCQNKGKFIIGNNFSVTSKPLPVLISVFQNTKLEIGDNIYLNFGVDIGCTKQITIGNNIMIGGYTTIMDNNFHYAGSYTTNIGKKIIISDNVWIGTRCIILPGVKIGLNSFVAAGSAVKDDVPEMYW